MIERTYVKAKHFLTKSKLNSSLACNPYGGCEHGCLYCYANYMVPGRSDYEAWGNYVEIREYPNLDIPKNTGSKQLIFSSACDAYQPCEREIGSTRKIMEAIHESDLKIQILTKSDLVLRDLDLFKKMKSVEIGFSIALSDREAKLFEPGATLPSARIKALKELKAANLNTYVFIAPIFPYLTDVIGLVDQLKDAVDYFMFDSFNLSNPQNRLRILRLIKNHYPDLYQEYLNIFHYQDKTYYRKLKDTIISHTSRLKAKVNYIYP
jgi:DNA repair photolyase